MYSFLKPKAQPQRITATVELENGDEYRTTILLNEDAMLTGLVTTGPVFDTTGNVNKAVEKAFTLPVKRAKAFLQQELCVFFNLPTKAVTVA